MRNLKKVLSLCVALVMLLGIMATASAVSFNDLTDKASVTHGTEVSLLVELGIINGIQNADGTYSYQPNGLVTRAQMATMICKIMNKGVDNSSLFTGTAIFDDTTGHWGEGYIAYCYNLGIIAGYGDGKFGPDDSVTGTQAAKMLLTALGYKADLEGYVNTPSYAININVDASTAGIYDGFTAGIDAALTRDNAALLIYNALNCTTVGYNVLTNVLVPNATTLAGEKFDLKKITGTLIANDNVNVTTGAAGTAKTAVIADTALTTVTLPVSTSLDLLGQNVIAYVKNASGTVVGANTTYTKVYGAVVANPGNVAGTFTVSKALASQTFALGGKTYILDPAYVGTTCTIIATASTNYNTAAPLAALKIGQTVKIVKNADTTVFALVIDKEYGTVANYNATAKTVDINATFIGKAFSSILSSVTLANGVKTLAYQVGTTGKYIVELPTTISGTVSGISYVGTTPYAVVDGANKLAATLTGVTETASTIGAVPGACSFYVENGFILGSVSVTAAALTYCVVEVDQSAVYAPAAGFTAAVPAKAQVKALLQDGTVAVYDVASYTNAAAATDYYSATDTTKAATGDFLWDVDAAADKIFSYTIGIDGKIHLTEAGSVTGVSAAYTTGGTTLSFTNATPVTITPVVDSKSIVFYKDTTSGYGVAIGAAKVPAIAAKGTGFIATDSIVVATSGVLKVAYIQEAAANGAAIAPLSTATTKIGYVTGAYSTSNGTTPASFTEYVTVWTGTETKTMIVTKTATSATVTESSHVGKLVVYTDTAGVIGGINDITVDGTLTLTGAESYVNLTDVTNDANVSNDVTSGVYAQASGATAYFCATQTSGSIIATSGTVCAIVLTNAAGTAVTSVWYL